MNPGRTARQALPRPPLWTPGAPAPWAELSSGRRRLTEATVRRSIDSEVLERSPIAPAGSPAAAVLAVLEPASDGELEVIITRRSERMRTHRGELSLPGGAQDPGEDLVRTALREANEEVGLAHDAVDVAGHLHPLRTASSGRWIVPFVAMAPTRPAVWAASPDEVDEVLHVPLSHLTDPGVFWEERWTMGDATWPISFFDLGPDVIWGATAAMLRDLLARLLNTPVPPRQDPAAWAAKSGPAGGRRE
ncbi:MAG: CoA pyrophosphatase [Microthrixaceae bacterium]